MLVDEKLKFHLHVRQVVSRAAALSINLIRSTVCCNSVFMTALYESHVRPTLDYGSTL